MGPKKANNNSKAASTNKKTQKDRNDDALLTSYVMAGGKVEGGGGDGGGANNNKAQQKKKGGNDASKKKHRKQDANDDELLNAVQKENRALLKAEEDKLPKILCRGCRKNLPSSRFCEGQQGIEGAGRVPQGYAWCTECCNLADPSEWPAFCEGLPDIAKAIPPKDLNSMVMFYFKMLQEKTLKEEFGGDPEQIAHTFSHPEGGGVPVTLANFYGEKVMKMGLYFPIFPPKWFGSIFTKVYATKENLAVFESALPKETGKSGQETVTNFKAFPNYLHRLIFSVLLGRIPSSGNCLEIAMLYTHLKDHVGANNSDYKVTAEDLKVQFQYQYSVDENWKPVTVAIPEGTTIRKVKM